MSRSYGKQPHQGRKSPPPLQPAEIQINITGRHTLEQFSLEVQRAVAMLQDYGVIGLERFRARLVPLDQEGRPIALRDEKGGQVMTINIPEVPIEAPYRENEPGVGFAGDHPSTSFVRKNYP